MIRLGPLALLVRNGGLVFKWYKEKAPRISRSAIEQEERLRAAVADTARRIAGFDARWNMPSEIPTRSEVIDHLTQFIPYDTPLLEILHPRSHALVRNTTWQRSIGTSTQSENYGVPSVPPDDGSIQATINAAIIPLLFQ